jgi:serine/threonine-protein kinase
VLDCLHRHRTVHGNITPRNVLIGREDHATKLTDLGLGPALAGSRLLVAVLEKKLLAELPYLAPEQAEPGAFVDDLADLYAVGAVAYALATGRPPVTGGSPEDVLDAVRNGRVVKPSAVYRKVPAAFEAVLLKLLAKAQEDRYPTPASLLEDLEPLVETHESGR